MTETQPPESFSLPASNRYPGLIILLFFGSGCAALIYEIVWFQLLQLVLGSSAVSLGVLLGTYMGGMCLGSLLLPRFVSAARNPLRVYALLEFCIGVVGALVLFAMPYVGHVYSGHVGHGLGGILLRGVVAVVCLLPPTLLMGATLPAIARWVDATPRGVSWLGFFYGGNIAGAVFGCLLAGFYLLRVHDMPTATYVAMAINFGVALLAVGLAAVAGPRLRGKPEADGLVTVTTQESGSPEGRRLWPAYLVIALSGLTALGAEVIWTRLLSLMLGGTVYTFSIILAVFLLGLGFGSGIGAFVARRIKRPLFGLGLCQLLLVGAIAWTAFMIARSLPFWPIDPSLSKNPWFNFQIDLVRCAVGTFPATVCWGASFPLALAAVAAGQRDAGRLVGGVYAANTVGAIVGAIGFSVVMIAWAGTQKSQEILIAIATLAALFAFAFADDDRVGVAGGAVRPFAMKRRLGLAVCLAIGGFLVWSVPKTPGGLVAYGRYLAAGADPYTMLFMGEGMNSSVAVTEINASGVRNFHVSGKVEASSEPQDMRLQRMLGHLPALLHPHPESVLIVGCGAGCTAGTFLLHPDIKRVVICEIEPLIPQVVAKYFSAENYGVVSDPRVTIVYDDARHFILTTKEKFDIITSDPIHPWVKGSATLYSKEYFELVKQHLNPGGMVTQWVPLYESNDNVVKSEIATFFDAFPEGTIWSNDQGGKGYDTVLLGTTQASPIKVDELQTRMDDTKYLQVTLSLDQVGLKSAVELLATYSGRKSDLAPWLKDAEINRDRNLRLQYLAGFGLNTYRSEAIYDEMLVYRKYPENIFVAGEESRAALEKAFAGPNERQ